MFSDCNMPPDSKEIKPGSRNQEASLSADKNTGVILVLCSRMEVCPYSYFRWYGRTDEFSVMVTKITSRIGVSLLFLTYFNSVNYGHIIKKM